MFMYADMMMDEGMMDEGMMMMPMLSCNGMDSRRN